MSKAKIITSDTVLEFVIEVYGITDPVMCVWCTERPPQTEADHNGIEQIQLDNTELFTKEDVESIYFPKGIIVGDWNKVIICLRHLDKPKIGWMMGATPTNFMSKNWIEEVDV